MTPTDIPTTPPDPAVSNAVTPPDPTVANTVTPPDPAVSNAVTPPDPATEQASEVPTSTHEPSLTLWELMRKDVDPTPSDEVERVLANPRQSVWDIEN